LPRGKAARETEAVRRGQSIFGQTMIPKEELAFLYDLALEAPDGPACEVGAFCGSSLMAWASARLGRGAIAAIDIESRPELEENIRHSGYPVEILIGDSHEVWEIIPEGLAFCFIDGDHTGPGIRRDMRYTVKVKRGGIIAFHDYDKDEDKKGKGYEVKAMVDAWQYNAQWEDLGQVGLVKAFRRPNDTRIEPSADVAGDVPSRQGKELPHSEIDGTGEHTGGEVWSGGALLEGVQAVGPESDAREFPLERGNAD